jgi:hypothetical protein
LNARRTNVILWLSAALLCAGAAVSLALGLFLPIADTDDSGKTAAQTPVLPATRSDGLQPPLAQFESIFSRRLRSAELEAAHVTALAPPIPGVSDASMPAMTLEGTVGNSLAIIRLADGSTILKAVGDEIAGARVVSISSAQVELQRDGQTILLSKPLPTSSRASPPQ